MNFFLKLRKLKIMLNCKWLVTKMLLTFAMLLKIRCNFFENSISNCKKNTISPKNNAQPFLHFGLKLANKLIFNILKAYLFEQIYCSNFAIIALVKIRKIFEKKQCQVNIHLTFSKMRPNFTHQFRLSFRRISFGKRFVLPRFVLALPFFPIFVRY